VTLAPQQLDGTHDAEAAATCGRRSPEQMFSYWLGLNL